MVILFSMMFFVAFGRPTSSMQTGHFAFIYRTPTISTVLLTSQLKTVVFFFGPVALRPNAGHGLLILEVYRAYSDAPQSVGLLWTSDQSDERTLQHPTLKTDQDHSYPRLHSNSVSAGERPKTYSLDRTANGTGNVALY